MQISDYLRAASPLAGTNLRVCKCKAPRSELEDANFQKSNFQQKMCFRVLPHWEFAPKMSARAIFASIVIAAVKFGFLDFVFNCWFAPALLVGVTLGLFFDYFAFLNYLFRSTSAEWLQAKYFLNMVSISRSKRNKSLFYLLWHDFKPHLKTWFFFFFSFFLFCRTLVRISDGNSAMEFFTSAF